MQTVDETSMNIMEKPRFRQNIKQNKRTKKLKKKKIQEMNNVWDDFTSIDDSFNSSSLQNSELDQNDLECIYEKDNVLDTNLCKTRDLISESLRGHLGPCGPRTGASMRPHIPARERGLT